jgi:hypothetical protein
MRGLIVLGVRGLLRVRLVLLGGVSAAVVPIDDLMRPHDSTTATDCRKQHDA